MCEKSICPLIGKTTVSMFWLILVYIAYVILFTHK